MRFNKMNELENKIYKCAIETALKIEPEIKNKIKESEIKLKYTEIPFFCEGVINILVYDNEKFCFTKIRYTKGKGKGIGCLMMNGAFFKETEICEINIS